MADFEALPKAYDASLVEDAIYAAWEQSGAFDPDKLPGDRKDPYCIVMPPPNRTGTLHMGHAAMLAIEDLMIRFQRMRGKRALWIPGTDHAAIATQVKVEQMLIAEGMTDPRKELGREKFLEKVVEFAEESATTIRNQVRKMGSSCDWTREKYTFDEERNRAVNAMFKMMFEDGIIERGYRVVNWDLQFQTTLSDDEVLTKETTAKLLTFKYDKDFPIAISTTRPETKFGDVAVAVHPSDDRYKQYVGKTFKPIFCGKELSIKIIADEAVDPLFGTGALGVTPAHSMIDAEMAERHGLPTIPVIDHEGDLLPVCGHEFVNLSILEARREIEKRLNDEKLLLSVEEIKQNLPVAERGGAPVEQLPMRQWFVRVNKSFALRQDAFGTFQAGQSVTLKQLMRHAVYANEIKIVPDRFGKTYFHWINNLRDWCISRQIWFGHRIPVWYHDICPISDEKGDKKPILSVEAPNKCPHCNSELTDSGQNPNCSQDPDTLDTWFSSGIWTFSTLGWPDAEAFAKNRTYHPTAVLETGYDILFFWVARMILMSSYALGEVPFKDVYLHGLVRDEQGRKMSKSLGNILDPLDLIPKYGTDAVRLSLVMGTTPGQDVKLSEAKIEGFRNFTNKLWNISRFILMTIGDVKIEDGRTKIEPKTLADQWILARLDETVFQVTTHINTYQFSAAGDLLRDFTWNDLADWYLEIAKVEKGKEQILSVILQTILKLWHPFMPFVTEHIWKTAGFEGALIVTAWPEAVASSRADARSFEALRSLITDIRRLRAEQGVEAAKQVEIAFVATSDVQKLIEENGDIVKHLARASSIAFTEKIADGWATIVSGATMIGLNTAGTVDVVKERAKAQKELEDTQRYVDALNKQLANIEFVSKAPPSVVDGMKLKLGEAEAKLKSLEAKVRG